MDNREDGIPIHVIFGGKFCHKSSQLTLGANFDDCLLGKSVLSLMLTLSLMISPFAHHIVDIVVGCSKKKVRGINAISYITMMANN